MREGLLSRLISPWACQTGLATRSRCRCNIDAFVRLRDPTGQGKAQRCSAWPGADWRLRSRGPGGKRTFAVEDAAAARDPKQALAFDRSRPPFGMRHSGGVA